MAHFAQLDITNTVVNVVVVGNDTINNTQFPESEELGINFLQSLYPNTTWKQTSFSSSFRKRYAAIGYTYSPKYDAFIPPKYFKSWKFDEQKCCWVAPVEKPTDEKIYAWDEESLAWQKIE